MPTRKVEDCLVKYKDDQQTKDAVFNKLLEFFLKHQTFSGECIMQSDGPQLEAPVLLSDIADNLMGFDVEYDWEKKPSTENS